MFSTLACFIRAIRFDVPVPSHRSALSFSYLFGNSSLDTMEPNDKLGRVGFMARGFFGYGFWMGQRWYKTTTQKKNICPVMTFNEDTIFMARLCLSFFFFLLKHIPSHTRYTAPLLFFVLDIHLETFLCVIFLQVSFWFSIPGKKIKALACT
ncbi:hypothetical protein V8F20_007688 [Naviculisporaceae sp. PSN 640]